MVKKDYFYCWYYDIGKENTNKNLSILVNNKKSELNNYLELKKVDEDTGLPLAGAGFKILVRTKDDKFGWLQADGKLSDNITTNKSDLITNQEGNIIVPNVPYGRYYVYETEAPEGYKLEEQVPNIYNCIKQIQIKKGGYNYKTLPKGFNGTFLNTNYLYCWYYDVDEEDKDLSLEIRNNNTELPPPNSLKIIKKDSTYEYEIEERDENNNVKQLFLANAHIKIYYKGEDIEGWIRQNDDEEQADNQFNDGDEEKIEYNVAEDEATEFVTDSNGVIEIKNLKTGTYDIYETVAPEGYDITKQERYDEAHNWVYLGRQIINENNKNPTVVYNNTKIAQLSGKVWIDKEDSEKGEQRDNLYGSDTNDELLNGITVNLINHKDGKNEVIARTQTDSNGTYMFDEYIIRKPNGGVIKEKLTYWKLAYCHIEFVYDNTKYVVVTPFKNGEDKIEDNSKAQPKEVKTTGGVTNLDSDRNNAGELYDGNLGGTNTNSEFYGSAITYNSGDTTNLSKEKIAENANASLNQRFLTGFYNEDNYTVENINLGLIEKVEPSFDVGQELEFVKVVRGNYSFTYQYGKDFVVEMTNEGVKYTQDAVAFEKNDRTFTQYIYPSDIAYNFAEERAENDKYEVYAVYKVMIKNNTTYSLQDLYREYTLRLTNLSYTYDSSKYQLDKKDIGYENSGYTGTNEEVNRYIENIKATVNNWNEADNNKLEWNLSEHDEVRAGNVGSIFVQFKVKDEALQELLQSIDGKLPEIKTKAIATGYHIYNRRDKNWAYTGNYSHFTKDDTKESAAFGFALKLKDTRSISGSIFEDKKYESRTDESRTDERIGNGEKDDGENAVSDVIVSLIDASKNGEVAKIYDGKLEQIDGKWTAKSQDATILVNEDGTYTLPGVVPGKYYLKFTYGNGTTLIKNIETKINGEKINSNLYKSTILTGAAKDVNEDNEKTWFLNNGQSSVATDDIEIITNRIKEENEKTEINNSTFLAQQLINANSPNLDIQFEYMPNTYIDANVIDSIKPICEGMNFGIIERPHVDIQLDKNIKNVKFTLQNGTTIINGNPNDQNVSSSLSSWADQEDEFNSTAKIELDSSLLYGSDISVSYEMVAHNESEVDYATENYYKYGIPGNSEDIVKTAVTRIVDYIDNGNAKYNISSDNITLENLDENKYLTANAKLANKNIGKKVFVAKGEGEKIGKLLTPSVKANDGSDRETYEITVSNLLSSGDELFGWENYSEIIGIRNKTKTPQSTSHFGSLEIKNPKTDEQDDANATIILTSTTGENRDLTIYYIITGVFVVLSIGLIFIIKKHKNK